MPDPKRYMNVFEEITCVISVIYGRTNSRTEQKIWTARQLASRFSTNKQRVSIEHKSNRDKRNCRFALFHAGGFEHRLLQALWRRHCPMKRSLKLNESTHPYWYSVKYMCSYTCISGIAISVRFDVLSIRLSFYSASWVLLGDVMFINIDVPVGRVIWLEDL